MDNTIAVKIGKLGGRSTEYILGENSTVQAVLDAAKADSNAFETAGYQLRVNGEPATPTTLVDDGDVVSLMPQVKGGVGN